MKTPSSSKEMTKRLPFSDVCLSESIFKYGRNSSSSINFSNTVRGLSKRSIRINALPSHECLI